MRTLLLAPELFARDGGIARILNVYLEALAAEPGGTVRIVSLNDHETLPAALGALPPVSVEAYRPCGRSKARFIAQALAQSGGCGRILCGHINQMPVAWALSRLRPGTRTYLVAHGIEVWRPLSRMERLWLGAATRVLCVSAYTRQEVLRRSGLPEDRVVVLHNALSRNVPVRPTPRPQGAAVILAVSRLTLADSYKGIDHLIDALAGVLRERPGTRLRIVGTGDARPSLEARARERGVTHAVEFLGRLSDPELHREFEACHVFALPSEREGFGLVYLEAMAHGRPCVAAQSAGAPEVVTAETGVLVPYGDVPALSSGLVGALQRDWPPAAFEKHLEGFSFERFRARLHAILGES